MLYSQALTGGHRASLPSSTSYSTTKTHQDTETPKQHHKNPTKTARTINPQHQHHHQNQHQPSNPAHKPNTPTKQESVYVQTLKTTPSLTDPLTDPLTALRRTHFPRHRDRGNLPAHLTLFHALPGSEMGHITAALEGLCGCAPQQQKPLRLATGAVFRMRRGVGIEVAEAVGGGEEGKGGDGHGRAGGESGPAAARRLHAELQRRWWAFLSAQDRRPWRPHWTVQNKAADEAAVDAAMDEAQAAFRGAEGLATGCALWRYDKGGRWAFERGFDFGGDK